MCGITGFYESVGFGGLSGDAISARGALKRMTEALTHRGPDSAGEWHDESAGIHLGHRRLSILDLSESGHQPMISASGRWVISFNGEIYNFAELRSDLESSGVRFRGHSDTEVMLAGIESWGVRDCLEKLNGMFAIALWDRHERRLHLVRDRFGEKPLYYGWSEGRFFFASELKALRAHPGFKPQLNRAALASYMRLSYVPAPFSIYQGIRKLEAGHWLTLVPTLGAASEQDLAYWSAADAYVRSVANPFEGSEKDALEQLETLLRESVRLRMQADVPLGAFLSGGIDSSLIVALMQIQSSRPIETFTIGFTDPAYNEGPHARSVATHLATRHTEFTVTPKEAQDVIPRLASLYDEPFADSSQIPTYLVSALARRSVTVTLSGDAGDELFGGYNRYLWATRVAQKTGALPASLRAIAGRAIQSLNPAQWNRLFEHANPILPRALRLRLPGDKLHKLADALSAVDGPGIYLSLISQWKNPSEIVLGTDLDAEPLTLHRNPSAWPTLPSFADQMMCIDAVTYLPDDILVKVDRASMGVSLESRVPFLDHRLAEFAWSLPLQMKIRDGKGKWALRKILDRHVPRDLIDRPKMGFGVPVDSWLRGPLRDWAEAHLTEDALALGGILAPAPIRRLWAEHLSGRRNHFPQLWNVLMFQAWRTENSF